MQHAIRQKQWLKIIAWTWLSYEWVHSKQDRKAYFNLEYAIPKFVLCVLTFLCYLYIYLLHNSRDQITSSEDDIRSCGQENIHLLWAQTFAIVLLPLGLVYPVSDAVSQYPLWDSCLPFFTSLDLQSYFLASGILTRIVVHFEPPPCVLQACFVLLDLIVTKHLWWRAQIMKLLIIHPPVTLSESG
jgi:hypothetical protein